MKDSLKRMAEGRMTPQDLAILLKFYRGLHHSLCQLEDDASVAYRAKVHVTLGRLEQAALDSVTF